MNNFDMATAVTIGLSLLGATYAYGQQTQRLDQIARDLNRIAESYRHLEKEFDQRMDILNERIVRLEARLEKGGRVFPHYTAIDEADHRAENL